MEGLKTQRGYSQPQVVQFSVFLDNRVGKLRGLLKLFEGTDVRMAAVSVVDSVDCAVVRCVLVPADEARARLKQAGLATSETDLVVAELPSSDALPQVCDALVKAEINIHYVYSLIVKPHGHSALALHVDEPLLAAELLRKSGFAILGEADL